MKNYELTYLISSEITEEEVGAFQEKIISSIKEEGGVLITAGIIGRKRLAYSIKEQTQAYLAVLEFELEPEKIANLEKSLKAKSKILRYLLLIKKVMKIVPKRVPKVPISPKKPKEEIREKKVELKEIEKKLEEILKE